jgi:hypothetical protein
MISASTPYSSSLSDQLLIKPPRNSFMYETPGEPPVSEAPYISSIDLTYSKPLVSSYTNLNADPRIHHRLSKYYRLKALDKWLYNDLKNLLGYLKVSGKNVSLISNLSNYKNKNESKEIMEMKIDYLEDELLTVKFIYRILRGFVLATNINWYDLHKNEKYLIQAFDISIKKKLKHLIKNN